MATVHDGRKVTTSDARFLTADELRALSQWCGNQRSHWWDGLPLGGILQLYHAANDAGYAGMDEWVSDNTDSRADGYIAWSDAAAKWTQLAAKRARKG